MCGGVGMANWKRINKSLQNKLNEQARFGQSKHEAKQRAKEQYQKEHGNLKGYNPSKVDGIYSVKTMETYRKVAEEYSKWCAKENINNATKLTREHAERYLKERNAEGKSAWTISRDMAALNKIFGYDMNKKDLGLKERRLEDIKRSREECKHDQYNQSSKYQEQIDFARGCGCRRQSITQITPKDLVWANNRVVAVHLIEKGGRERTAPVLNEMKDRLTEIALNHAGEDKLFKEYGEKIDNHSFRAEYASNLLHQLEREREQGQQLCQGDFEIEKLCNLRGNDISDEPYRGHDRDICGMVSGALGHNRLDIVFTNYNYK